MKIPSYIIVVLFCFCAGTVIWTEFIRIIIKNHRHNWGYAYHIVYSCQRSDGRHLTTVKYTCSKPIFSDYDKLINALIKDSEDDNVILLNVIFIGKEKDIKPSGG